MLWIKAFHMIMVVSWFSGLFYLPRILVNLAMVHKTSQAERRRLLLMARKLLRFMHILALGALGLGFVLLGGDVNHFKTGWWLHLKLGLVVVLVGYHLLCGYYVSQFEEHHETPSHIWFRWFNEIPVILLTAIVILVVVRPI